MLRCDAWDPWQRTGMYCYQTKRHSCVGLDGDGGWTLGGEERTTSAGAGLDMTDPQPLSGGFREVVVRDL